MDASSEQLKFMHTKHLAGVRNDVKAAIAGFIFNNPNQYLLIQLISLQNPIINGCD